MIIEEITEENIEEYIDPVPKDFLPEIRRRNFSGLAGKNEDTGDTAAAMIWELKNLEEEDASIEAEILWFYAKEKEKGAELLRAFESRVRDDEAERVFFELPELGTEEQAALLSADYGCRNAESRDIIVTMKELSELKLSRKPIGKNILPLSNITEKDYKTGILTAVFHGKYGLLEDLPFLPRARFEPEVSCCIRMDEKVNGYLLVHKNSSGISRVELLFAMQPDANVHLLDMMRFSIHAAFASFSPEEKVILSRHNEAASQLITRLFPGKKGMAVSKGERRI